MSLKLMKNIASVIHAEKRLSKCYLVHRTGHVPVGQASIVIATSSTHRDEAHSAVLEILNQVKSKVPVWKKVVYSVNRDMSSAHNGCWSDKSEAFWLTK